MIPQVIYRCLWAMVLIAAGVAAGVITSPAVLPRATARAVPGEDCDGHSIFWCPLASGTCYTGTDGYVGCCSTSSCAARTTCKPYDPKGLQKCDQNTGGCWSCSDSMLPACFTVTNVAANQHIWYCSTTKALFATSYKNLVTIGSMASPPGVATMTTGPKTVQTSMDATTSPTMGPASTTETDTIPTSNLSSQTQTGLSTGAIAGIVIGVIGVLAIIAIIVFLWYRRRSRRRDLAQHVIDASCAPRNGHMPQKQHVPPSPIDDGPDIPQPTYTDAESPSYIARSIANDPEDYFSPLEISKRANAAEALSRLESRDRGMSEMGADGEHTVDRTIGRAEIGSRSGDTTGGIWMAVAAQPGNPSANGRNRDAVTELESSPTREGEGGLNIQRVSPPPRQTWRAPYPADEELAQRNQQAFGANSVVTSTPDSNGISPALTNTTFDRNSVVSPLLSGGTFSTTPLMPLNKKPSVGELNPRATVEGPLNWPILATNRNSSKLTSATGWESKYLSPEMAISNGFSAGEMAEDANMASEERNPGPSDAAFIMPARMSR